MNNDNIITIDLGNGNSYDLDITTATSSDSIYISDYVNASSDTITLGPIDTLSGYASTDIKLDMDWFEDQRIVEEYREEQELRERNEGIQAAWEQYKILVELAKNPPENLDNQ